MRAATASNGMPVQWARHDQFHPRNAIRKQSDDEPECVHQRPSATQGLCLQHNVVLLNFARLHARHHSEDARGMPIVDALHAWYSSPNELSFGEHRICQSAAAPAREFCRHHAERRYSRTRCCQATSNTEPRAHTPFTSRRTISPNDLSLANEHTELPSPLSSSRPTTIHIRRMHPIDEFIHSTLS